MNIFIGGQTDRRYMQTLVTCKQVGGLEQLFDKLLDETKTALVQVNEVDDIRRLQGRAKVLADFLEAMQQAPSVLERLR